MTTCWELLQDMEILSAALCVFSSSMGEGVFALIMGLGIYGGLYLVAERIELPTVAALLTAAAMVAYLPPRAAVAAFIFLGLGVTGVAYKLWVWKR